MPPARSPVADVLAALAGGFGSTGTPWYLFGAQAALVLGAARLTSDVDVTAFPGSVTTAALLRGVLDAGFVSRVDDVEDFVARTRVLPLAHGPTGIPVDVVLAGPGLEEEFLSRATPRDVEGVIVPVASAEDVVIMKVLAARPLDLQDVTAILAAAAEFDDARVRVTLGALEDALGQSDLLPSYEAASSRARRAALGRRRRVEPID